MKNAKLVAYGLIASLGLAVLVSIFEPFNGDDLYQLSGLGFFVFGIWASIILLKNSD